GAGGSRAQRQRRDRDRAPQGRWHPRHAEEGGRRLERRRARVAGRRQQGAQAPARPRRPEYRRGEDAARGELPEARRRGRELASGERHTRRDREPRTNLGADRRQILERQSGYVRVAGATQSLLAAPLLTVDADPKGRSEERP